MTLELKFKDICAVLKKEGKQDPKLIAAVDQLLGLALICSPAVFSPDVVSLLPTLAVKNEIIKIGKAVFEKLTKRQDTEYLGRQETMQMAYGLLIFTAFFDALDLRLPKSLRDEIALMKPERAFLAEDGVRKTGQATTTMELRDYSDGPIVNISIAFPHPTELLSEQTRRQEKLWKQMGQGFLEFVQKLALWENADEKKHAALVSAVQNIEKETTKVFEAQYFELARKFEDFAIWANLQAHKDTKALIGRLSDYVKKHSDLVASSENAIDVGFKKLNEIVLQIPDALRIQQSEELVESLKKHYQARINDPIIDDREEAIEDKPRLSFPKVCDAFVPQAFRVLRYGGVSRRLEDRIHLERYS